MESLRNVILGMGQRIDGQQAPSIPNIGNTPLDSTTPPPLPPPFVPTIQQDHTAPSPPPPLVQLTSQVEAFVLRGHIETMPHSVVALTPVVDHTQARIVRIE